MKPGGGGRKGSAFERETAKTLSSWLYGDSSLLWRVGASGARATIHQKAGTNLGLFAGDIVPVGKQLPYPYTLFIETKHYKEIDLWKLFNPALKGEHILPWWRKAKKQAPPYQPHVLLVLRANNKPTLAVLSKKLWAQFKRTDISVPRLTFYPNGIVLVPFEALLKLDPVPVFRDNAINEGRIQAFPVKESAL